MVKMKKLIIFMLPLVFAGCAEVANTMSMQIRSPQGDNWIGVDCVGHSYNACLAEAGRQCPNGYEIIYSENHFAIEAKSEAVATPEFSREHSSEHEVNSGSMTIKCHGKSKADIDAELSVIVRHDESHGPSLMRR